MPLIRNALAQLDSYRASYKKMRMYSPPEIVSTAVKSPVPQQQSTHILLARKTQLLRITGPQTLRSSPDRDGAPPARSTSPPTRVDPCNASRLGRCPARAYMDPSNRKPPNPQIRRRTPIASSAPRRLELRSLRRQNARQGGDPSACSAPRDRKAPRSSLRTQRLHHRPCCSRPSSPPSLTSHS
ncbi:hypothetical protein EUGRSUZ_F03023 [Eucalyptus grandis]|uniref:Uncharacterized protein n=2 Tax=Eucalyptus grandis TaxID=71139 RepID=A0ACC3KJV5_EUCGR|nr:hypothetical protein EUGRSUZ_F03023 [Eucalyptus grandis]